MALLLGGCPKGKDAFSAGRLAENRGDFDTALDYYKRALRAQTSNVDYKVKVSTIAFEAAAAHISQGQKLRKQGDLERALLEFEKAESIDPSSPIAAQELQRTSDMIAATRPTVPGTGEHTDLREGHKLAEKPPELIPVSRAPINLKMSNDAKVVFETVGKLAGVSVVFDPDFPARRISVELVNVTLEQALEVVSIEAKAFSSQ